MPANNGLTLALKNCDVEIENAAGDIYGFPSFLSTIPEDRVSQLTASTGEAAPTFKSAEPFEAVEWSDFSYGYGQVNGDREEGGVAGMGGNPAQYFYGDCFSLFPSKLLPGMARDQVYNTIGAAQMTPISDGIDPVAGDEMEVPRGVVPSTLYTFPKTPTSFTTAASGFTLTNIRVLLQLKKIAGGNFQVSGELRDATGVTVHAIFLAAINSTTFGNYTGWKWVTLTNAGFALSATTTYKLYFNCNSATAAAIGCYIGSGNQIAPYFQLLNAATPYKYWAAPPAKMEQVLNGSTYVNVAITTAALFNTDATATGGTAPATSPERTHGGTFLSSIPFNGKLYVSITTTTGTHSFTPAALAANGASTVFDTNVCMFSPVEHEGILYYADATRVQIQKWTGNFPAAGADCRWRSSTPTR
jgi:hypothetical protein